MCGRVCERVKERKKERKKECDEVHKKQQVNERDGVSNEKRIINTNGHEKLSVEGERTKSPS